MKLSLAILLATILGVAAGVGAAALRLMLCAWNGDPAGMRDPRMPEAAPADDHAPKVAVDKPEHDFGSMSFDAKGQHDFVFRNLGDGPLKLVAGPTSCRCALSQIADGEVASGESTKVTLKWTAKELSGPYRQTATILTNDPVQPRVTLTVIGRITVAVRPVPAELVLGQISGEEPATGKVRLFCYLAEPLKILGHTLSDRETAKYFEVACEPIPADQLREAEQARSGVLLTVTVKPGLLQGPFQQTILLRTNLESAPALDVPIQGTVVGDIAIVGAGWDDEHHVLTIGGVRRQEGAQRRLLLIARGPHRKEIEFTPVVDEPDVLKVTVGKCTPIQDGNVTQTPLLVEVLKGSRPVNRLGSEQGKLGRFTLKTNHPKLPKLRIFVSFAVEG